MKSVTYVFLAALWFLFNSVAASAEDAGLDLQSTVLFREHDGRLEQMVRAHVPDTIKAGATLRVDGPGYSVSRELSSLGKLRFDSQEDFLFPLPELREATTVEARLQDGSQTLSGTYYSGREILNTNY